MTPVPHPLIDVHTTTTLSHSADQPQPLSELFTARMISAMFTVAPSGMPCAQADGWANPRMMFTSVISSPIVTVEPPSQSPTQSDGGVAVGVAPVGTVGVAVGDGAAEGVALAVSAPLGVRVTVDDRVGVAEEDRVDVAVLVPVGAPVAV